MTDQTTEDGRKRTFLCVVDDSEELSRALRFACDRARKAGARIGLLYVVEPAEFQHWMAVGELMAAERRSEAEEMLQVVASTVQRRTGHMPTLFIREGDMAEELVNLVSDRENNISLLILGAATGTEGPGPLVTHVVTRLTGSLRIPVTVVPGEMTDEEIAAIT
ncbi:MAG: universal stress protein [Rhodobacterales bacterium]|nr:universal stress protein [Rhodobacterales bacterium]